MKKVKMTSRGVNKIAFEFQRSFVSNYSPYVGGRQRDVVAVPASSLKRKGPTLAAHAT